jgi:hypothetical protein
VHACDNEQLPIARFRAPDGALIAEVDLTQGRHPVVEQLVSRARTLDADKLWLHAHLVDAGLGFVRRGSYLRLEAPAPPAPIDLARPPAERIRVLQRACYGDVWGRHDPGNLPDDGDSVFVGLHEHGTWVGICEVDVDGQWIDGPGIVPQLRTPDRYARLVRGAAAHLQQERVVLETWGDPPAALDAYGALGFEIVQSVPGWELDLHASR